MQRFFGRTASYQIILNVSLSGSVLRAHVIMKELTQSSQIAKEFKKDKLMRRRDMISITPERGRELRETQE